MQSPAENGTTRKRILVAGATGYLGRYVALECKRRGHFVRALARSPHKLDDIRESLDEIVTGEITRPETISGICDGIDTVFSSVGITRQKDGLTFRDVDYLGNKHLLDLAKSAGVSKFMYVSILHGPQLRRLAIVDAHEMFVDALRESGLDYVVMRPTGYFSDMEEFLTMAKKGRVYLFGSGQKRMNPIHGADLASCCAESLTRSRAEIEVGGPEVLTYRQCAQAALRATGRPEKISSVPVWLTSAAVGLVWLFNRHQGELLRFFTTMMTTDVVAPAYGRHTLESHFDGIVTSRNEM